MTREIFFFKNHAENEAERLVPDLFLCFKKSLYEVRFGRKSIIHSTTLTWNYLQDKLTEYNFLCLTPKSLKILLVKFFISEYNS